MTENESETANSVATVSLEEEARNAAEEAISPNGGSTISQMSRQLRIEAYVLGYVAGAKSRRAKLPKVRELVADLKKALSEATGSELTMLDPSEWEADIDAALSELDAAEGRGDA